MAGQEFDIIREYFSRLTRTRDDTLIGIGDDCALLKPADQQVLAVSTDTLVAGTHFFPDTSPADLGHKALAVNLSDLAAMGATPAWVTLALTLPEIDRTWLRDFCEGFAQLARQFDVQLVGGDLTRGPLSITLTVHGQVPHTAFLTRSGAQPGDRIFVSGALGNAAYALQCLQAGQPAGSLPVEQLNALQRPQPRLLLGQALRGIASACIDVSDGLLADVGHLCEASACGARLQAEQLPIAGQLVQAVGQDQALALALTGGDDYELCFTVAPALCDRLSIITEQTGLVLHEIGEINPEDSPVCVDIDGNPITLGNSGFQHF